MKIMYFIWNQFNFLLHSKQCTPLEVTKASKSLRTTLQFLLKALKFKTPNLSQPSLKAPSHAASTNWVSF